MPKHRHPLIRLFPLFIVVQAAASVNFTVCFQSIQSIANATQNPAGLYYNNGTSVTVDAIFNATAMSYEICASTCGSAQVPFQPLAFSQQVNSWLLPYFALISQLPFGAKDGVDNLVAAFLTIGSPVLAGYSMCLTLLNSRWISRQLESVSYPNAAAALQILVQMQQVPLRVSNDYSLLNSLVLLPENDKWWGTLAERLDYNHSWTITAAISIMWAVIAYLLSVIQSWIYYDSSGLSGGHNWLWLLPIVAGWLQLSPKCDFYRVRNAFLRTRDLAYIATRGKPVKVSTVTGRRAVSLASPTEGASPDEARTPPVFDYAKAIPWARESEKLLEVFRSASRRAIDREPVTPQLKWEEIDEEKDSDHIHPNNRNGSLGDVNSYCLQYLPNRAQEAWPAGIFGRMFAASLLPLALQWATSGAAIIVVWFTLTLGLGCRSLALLLYAAMSTVAWMLFVISSILAFYSATRTPRLRRTTPLTNYVRLLSNVFRWSGKALAIFNALWMFTSSVLQYTNVYNRCYCNSNAIAKGSTRAWITIIISDLDRQQSKSVWIGAVALALCVVVIYIGSISLLKQSTGRHAG
ncbi:hypothetical protein F5I97DRAFT_288500 [Phlebopus sp. FC_14]|nr:hypothetical protein F5I97DRAFT_288500 [Phlebopus sp. FC_14]